MIVAIHQPQYLPWIGYFDKIDCADVFVLLDNVQYKKRLAESQSYQDFARLSVDYRWWGAKSKTIFAGGTATASAFASGRSLFGVVSSPIHPLKHG